jgi:hypothetical protein
MGNGRVLAESRKKTLVDDDAFSIDSAEPTACVHAEYKRRTIASGCAHPSKPHGSMSFPPR